MRIVEPDFILSPCGNSFDLIFYKKVKSKETNEIKIEPYIAAYGCSLASALSRVIKHRLKSVYESETPCLLDVFNKIIENQNEIIKLCKESIPENFDTGE